MFVSKIIEFLGWLTAVSFGLALLNYILKWLNKNLIPKLPENLKKYVPLYQKLMKLVIKNHKWFGFLAFAAVGTHFIIAFTSGFLSLTGIVSALLMMLMVFLGIYGTYVKNRKKGPWLLVHRSISVLMVLTIIIHII